MSTDPVALTDEQAEAIARAADRHTDPALALFEVFHLGRAAGRDEEAESIEKASRPGRGFMDDCDWLASAMRERSAAIRAVLGPQDHEEASTGSVERLGATEAEFARKGVEDCIKEITDAGDDVVGCVIIIFSLDPEKPGCTGHSSWTSIPNDLAVLGSLRYESAKVELKMIELRTEKEM